VRADEKLASLPVLMVMQKPSAIRLLKPRKQV